LPSSIAGTANAVFSWTVVAFGYHVALRANRAKLGKAPPVDPRAVVHEQLHRQRIEYHHDDRGGRRGARVPHARVARGHQA
jgi:hypothetical protein